MLVVERFYAYLLSSSFYLSLTLKSKVQHDIKSISTMHYFFVVLIKNLKKTFSVSSFQFLKILHVSLSLSSCTTPQTLFPVINDKAVELIFMFSTYPLKSSSQKQVGISTCFHNVTISNKTAITKDICFYLKAPCHPPTPLTNKATLKMNALKLYIIRCSHKHKTQI